MDPQMPPHAQVACREMRVEIPREQRQLEEQHARVPDEGAAAHQREHHLAEHRLNEKQQPGTEKDRDGEERAHQALTRGRKRTSARAGK
jgi:hypothetical protein